MPIYSFLHSSTQDVIAIVEAPTYARALELAVRRRLSLNHIDLGRARLHSAFLAQADFRGATLSAADLSGCYLRNADLRGADLRGTRLAHAFLGEADLCQADIRGAELARADLREARLVGADLRGTILTGARLDGALCDWRWSAIPAELLRQHPDSPGGDSRLIIEMAFHDDPRPWSWLKLLNGYGKRADWALAILADSVRDGDNAPDLLRCLTTDAARGPEGSFAALTSASYTGDSVGPDCDRYGIFGDYLQAAIDIPTASRMLWTRRRMPMGGAARNTSDP
jgi:uncharacterized protein YjbI with pentapeptide repeats